MDAAVKSESPMGTARTVTQPGNASTRACDSAQSRMCTSESEFLTAVHVIHTTTSNPLSQTYVRTILSKTARKVGAVICVREMEVNSVHILSVNTAGEVVCILLFIP